MATLEGRHSQHAKGNVSPRCTQNDIHYPCGPRCASPWLATVGGVFCTGLCIRFEHGPDFAAVYLPLGISQGTDATVPDLDGLIEPGVVVEHEPGVEELPEQSDEVTVDGRTGMHGRWLADAPIGLRRAQVPLPRPSIHGDGT